ncbi:MAG: hypothetical protein PHI31_15235 [Desulfuromonadaceae bacterium]|nr:hypothetical protein [Desulfuromonadaceae bacterium]
MKCPKCGFNSFEYYDSCKKCSSDLSGFKKTYVISSVVLPQEIKEQKANEYKTEEVEAKQNVEVVDSHDDIFSFDLGESSINTPVFGADSTIVNDALSHDESQISALKQGEDFFSDLLESNSQIDESLFTTPVKPASSVGATAKIGTVGPSEFDLENFSWDDTPSSNSDIASASAPDDFDSLFGDTKDKDTKPNT